ncbi:MAG: hypothetical protein JOS17DRAFT_739234 [Linnemannia elongata]|nr:MAG: hypothetical protein JOS17DRAFT_739234 [Linnemannia elongata]
MPVRCPFPVNGFPLPLSFFRYLFALLGCAYPPALNSTIIFRHKSRGQKSDNDFRSSVRLFVCLQYMMLSAIMAIYEKIHQSMSLFVCRTFIRLEHKQWR